VKLAIAAVEVPCQAVAVQLEGHDAIACLLEAMDDESPLLLSPVCESQADRFDCALSLMRPKSLVRVLNSQCFSGYWTGEY
jgi:hypothetical protein